MMLPLRVDKGVPLASPVVPFAGIGDRGDAERSVSADVSIYLTHLHLYSPL